MAAKTLRRGSSEVWSLAERQHGVVTRAQLLELGLSAAAIKHRLDKGRLHFVGRGVYAVGRPELSQLGRWMAAVLGCGPGTVLSHESAAALWKLRKAAGPAIEVSVPPAASRRRPGVVVWRRALGHGDVTASLGIPVTTPACTLIDLAARLGRGQLEAAINEADKRDLVSPEQLRLALDGRPRRPGLAPLRAVLDERVFTLTDSALERRFLPVARKAGLPQPLTGRYVNGFKVDFYWPDLGLVVETDGLRYHRTAAQQARDRLRDQAHTAAGLTPLRFTHGQLRFEPEEVQVVLQAVAARLR